jgi:hypothetical protein
MGNLLPAGTGIKKYRKIEDEKEEIFEEEEILEQAPIVKE